MRKIWRALGAMMCIAVLLFVCAGWPAAALADSDKMTFKTVKAAVDYVKKNQPTELNLGSVRYKPSELLSIYRAMPAGAALHFTTTWGGCKFSDTSEEVDLKGIKTSVAGSDFEAIIALCPNVKKIDNSTKRTPSNDVMIPMIEKYPEIEFGWIIHIAGTHYCPSTATAYSTFNEPSRGYKLKSSQMEPLKYCKNLQALDLGHNKISSLDFLKYFPNMQLLIVACDEVTDITPIGNLKHLKYLEIFTNNISDLSPLANCTELLDLNITNNPVTDLSPLDGIQTLERFWANLCKQLPEEEKARFRELHPDCAVDYKGGHATPNGWRTHPRYKHYLWCLRNNQWVPFDEPLPTKKK